MINFLIVVGISLVCLGFLLVFLSIITSILRGGTEVRKGAVIMIGPIPIILVDDPHTAKVLIILALILTVASFSMIFLLSKG